MSEIKSIVNLWHTKYQDDNEDLLKLSILEQFINDCKVPSHMIAVFENTNIVYQLVKFTASEELFLCYTAQKVLVLLLNEQPEIFERTYLPLISNFCVLHNYLKLVYCKLEFHPFMKFSSSMSHVIDVCCEFIITSKIKASKILEVLNCSYVICKIIQRTLLNKEPICKVIDFLDNLKDFVKWFPHGLTSSNLIWRSYFKIMLKVCTIVEICEDKSMKETLSNICWKSSCKTLDLLTGPVCVLKSSFCCAKKSSICSQSWVIDDCILRRALLFGFAASLMCFDNKSISTEFINSYINVYISILKRYPIYGNEITSTGSLILDLFLEQDDELFDLLAYDLQMYTKCNKGLLWKIYPTLKPHRMFFNLLKSIAFDHTVLLDWLLLRQPRVTRFFETYFRLVCDEYTDFVQGLESDVITKPELLIDLTAEELTCNDEEESNITPLVLYSSSDEEDVSVQLSPLKASVDDIMSCLIRLSLSLARLHSQNLLSVELLQVLHLLNIIEGLHEE